MAGGLATRLGPLTNAMNKHMLPVYDKPMIQRNIETLVGSGITDILVLLSNTFAQPIMELLIDGRAFGARILYGYVKEGTSVGRHILCARCFTGKEPFMLYLGDSFYRKPLSWKKVVAPHMWVMPLEADDDFHKYAEVRLDGMKVAEIVEKPTIQRIGIVQTGAWIFPHGVFDLAESLIKKTHGEVQVRTIVSEYVKRGLMTATLLPRGAFLDLGTREALYQANVIARKEFNAKYT